MKTLKRDKKIQARLKLGNGQVITVNLDAMSIMREFGPKWNVLAEAEQKAVAAVNTPTSDAETIFEAYGNAIFAVMDLFFGEKQRNYIVAFYENNYLEMSRIVLPFITDDLMKQVLNILGKQRDELAKKYSGR